MGKTSEKSADVLYGRPLWSLHLYAVFEYRSVCKALLSDMHKLQRQPFKD
jgi:hypothetical protein